MTVLRTATNDCYICAAMLSFSSKKKDRLRPRLVVPRLCQQGAICWNVVLDDSGQGGKLVDCLLGVSVDSIVLVEEASREIVFVSPTKSVLGWALQGTCLRIYHHQGIYLSFVFRQRWKM